MAKTLDLTADVIDLRDITDRFETLEDELTAAQEETGDSGPLDEWVTSVASNDTHDLQDEANEFILLTNLLDDLRGYGGDHQWRGDWYPGSLIADDYFIEYAEQLAEDIGAISKDATWPNQFIDWDSAADALKEDYSEVEVDGKTYQYR